MIMDDTLILESRIVSSLIIKNSLKKLEKVDRFTYKDQNIIINNLFKVIKLENASLRRQAANCLALFMNLLSDERDKCVERIFKIISNPNTNFELIGALDTIGFYLESEGVEKSHLVIDAIIKGMLNKDNRVKLSTISCLKVGLENFRFKNDLEDEVI